MASFTPEEVSSFTTLKAVLVFAQVSEEVTAEFLKHPGALDVETQSTLRNERNIPVKPANNSK